MNITKAEPIYSRLIQPRILYRADGNGQRYYHTIDGDDVRFYPSVTSIIDATQPMPFYLKKWIADMGLRQAERYRDERAAYGTFMHMMIGELLMNGTLDLDGMADRIADYCTDNGYDYDWTLWTAELKKDLVAFNHFATEYNIKPIAIEMMLASDTHGFAGAIDLVCMMTVQVKGFWGETYKTGDRKGQPKETKQAQDVVAIVDFKSGRHSFNDSNDLQANMYMMLWNENFPETPVERCYNWSPKDWQKVDEDSVPYHLKDQTSDLSKSEVPHMVALFGYRERHKPKDVLSITGSLTIGATNGLVVSRKAIEDVVKEWHNKKEQLMSGCDREDLQC